MKKSIILFLIFLILPNFSLACDKEDFLKFVSGGKKKCIALQTIGKIERNKKNLIIFLHGDLSSGAKPPGKKGYWKLGNELLSDNVNFFFLARPGYTLDSGRKSYGSYKETRKAKTNYKWEKLELVAKAAQNLKEHYNANNLIMIGHSGGALTSATINSRVPKLIDKSILISCPCDFEKWRKMRGESIYKMKTSPHKNISGISKDSHTIIIVGKNDTNTFPILSKKYHKMLISNGLKSELHIIEGKHSSSSLINLSNLIKKYID